MITDQRVLDARRAWGQAQQLLMGGPTEPTQSLVVGWHGSSVHPETGAFAVVNRDSGLDSLVGHIVRATFSPDLYCNVFVIDSVTMPDATVELSLARRAFCSLARLSMALIQCDVARAD